MFIKGKSGNPAGKPKGTLSKITQLKNDLLDIGKDRIAEIRKMPIRDLVRCLVSIMPRDINIDVDSKSLIVNINKSIPDGTTLTPIISTDNVIDTVIEAEVLD